MNKLNEHDYTVLRYFFKNKLATNISQISKEEGKSQYNSMHIKKSVLKFIERGFIIRTPEGYELNKEYDEFLEIEGMRNLLKNDKKFVSLMFSNKKMTFFEFWKHQQKLSIKLKESGVVHKVDSKTLSKHSKKIFK